MDKLQDSVDNRGFFSKHAKDIVVIIVLALIVYIMVEQSVRVYLFGTDAFSYAKMSSMRSTGVSGNTQPPNIKKLGYELKPGLDRLNKLVSFKTNSRGLRDKEYALLKPPNTFRVAVVGGSYTMGSGIEIEDAYHSVLEDRLNEESNGLSYEFINFGLGGYKITHKLAVIKHKVLEYDPDLVLLVLDGSQYLKHKNNKIVFGFDRYSFFKSYSYKLLKTSELFGKDDRGAQRFISRHTNLTEVLDKQLRKVIKIAEKNGFQVCVIVLDHDSEHLELSQLIASSVREANLCFSNTVPAFKGTNFIDYTVSKIDKHPNAKANSIFADVIYRDLQRQLLLGTGDPEGAKGESHE